MPPNKRVAFNFETEKKISHFERRTIAVDDVEISHH